jgi:hypothetical protein
MYDLLLGHWIGDYILQTHEIATNKSKPDAKGFWACTIHCILYTISVMICLLPLFTSSTVFLASIALVYISHYFIDRYSVAYKIMEMKGGPAISEPFAPSIYIIIDNGMHIVLMYVMLTLIGVTL